MKGPYERLKYDLRRVWECPQCQRRQRTDGTITGLICDCQLAVEENQRVSMRLSRDDIRRSSVKQPQPSTPPSDSVEPAPTPTLTEPAAEGPSSETVAADPDPQEETAEAIATDPDKPINSEDGKPDNTPGTG